MNKKISIFCLLASGFWLLVSGFWSQPALAGGPVLVDEQGVPVTWNASDSNPIVLDPEDGSCASFSNFDMVGDSDGSPQGKILDLLSFWTDIPGMNLAFENDLGQIGDVTSNNDQDFLGIGDDGLNPVIFDNDGEITDAVFGECSRFVVLGFAGPLVGVNGNDISSTIEEGEAVFNCRCLSGNPSGNCVIPSDPSSDCDASSGVGDDVAGMTVVFSEDELNATVVHEIGHMIGLGHTAVNDALVQEKIDPNNPPCDLNDSDSGGGGGDCDDIPTMHPFAVDAADQITPTRDDEVSALSLYGGSTLNSDCTVIGSLEDVDGLPLRCAEVEAETTNNADTIGQVSGVFAKASDSDGDVTDGLEDCSSDCGDFTLAGLDPAKTYTIKVKPIDEAYVFGSGILPCASNQLNGIVEETIATNVNCSSGEILDLGVLSTNSTGGVDEGGGGGAIGCGLSQSPGSARSVLLIFAMGLFVVVCLRQVKRE